MFDYYLFSLPYGFYDVLNELNKLMKEILAEQKARIALGNHIAQLKYAKQYAKVKKPYFAVAHIYYPIRATKCNKISRYERCFQSREKKYGKRV